MSFRIDYDDRDVRGITRVVAASLGVLCIPGFVIAAVQLNYEMMGVMGMMGMIMLTAGFRGRSIVHRFLPLPRRPVRPDVSPALLDDAPEPVRHLVRGGKTIDAIRVYRQATGAPLTEGKRVIDGLAWREKEARVQPLLPQVTPEVRELIARGDVIRAVRRFRDRTGVSLPVAVEVMDVLQATPAHLAGE